MFTEIKQTTWLMLQLWKNSKPVSRNWKLQTPSPSWRNILPRKSSTTWRPRRPLLDPPCSTASSLVYNIAIKRVFYSIIFFISFFFVYRSWKPRFRRWYLCPWCWSLLRILWFIRPNHRRLPYRLQEDWQAPPQELGWCRHLRQPWPNWWICCIHPRPLRPFHGRLPIQPLPYWRTIQRNGTESIHHLERSWRRIEGYLLPIDWHVQGCPTKTHRWPLLVQGRWSFLASRQCLPFLAQRTWYLPQWHQDILGLVQRGRSFAFDLHANGWWFGTSLPSFGNSRQRYWKESALQPPWSSWLLDFLPHQLGNHRSRLCTHQGTQIGCQQSQIGRSCCQIQLASTWHPWWTHWSRRWHLRYLQQTSHGSHWIRRR